MTIKQYLVAGVIEQAIVLGIILPATGWWFSFFAISAWLNPELESDKSSNISKPFSKAGAL